MVFDVARPFQLVEVIVTLEFLEQFLGRLAEYVDEHIDTAPMGHTNNDLVDARGATLLDQVIEHRYEALAAFQ